MKENEPRNGQAREQANHATEEPNHGMTKPRTKQTIEWPSHQIANKRSGAGGRASSQSPAMRTQPTKPCHDPEPTMA